MTQVLLDWDDRQWQVDTEEITLAQAFMIKDSTKDVGSWPSGRPLQPWLAGVTAGDPACLRGMYWLMLAQDGQQQPVANLEFKVVKYHNAWVLASTLASSDASQLREIINETEKQLGPLRDALAAAEQREAEEQAAEAEGPTRPRGTASRRSAAPG
jgi:hypothetical protein